MQIHLKIIGCLLSILAWVHIIFPKYFNWKVELKPLSLINKQMMQVHTFFIALTVFLFGLLSFCCADLLVHSQLGKYICLGFFIFWIIRLYFQLFVYSSLLWKGKLFETTMHILFTLFWIYLCLVYGYITFT